MKSRPKNTRLPTLLFSLLALLAGGVAAREYPLFLPKNPQNFVFQFSAVSDQLVKGNSMARLQFVDKGPEEKFPFLRLIFDVRARDPKIRAFAGILFKLNDAKIIRESDVQNAILLRLRPSDPELRMTVILRDDRGGEASLDLSRFQPMGNSTWKYYEFPFNEFEKSNPAIRPFLDSITIEVNQPGQGTLDVAMVGINAP